MKALYISAISAASIALIGGLPAKADDSPAATDGLAQTRAPVDTARADAAFGSLLTQARAVLAARQSREASTDTDQAELEITVVDIQERLVADVTAAESTCQRMPIPGSRIRATRCYLPSSGEAALNDYQFQEEMRQIRRQQAMRVMQESQYDRVTLENQRAGNGQR